MGANRFTLSEVASLVGAKAHAVQYWAREGILRPDPETVGAGRGKHRTFPAGEVRVAAVAAALGPFGMSVPLLREICDHVRPVITPELAGEVQPGTSGTIQAMRAEELVIMSVVRSGERVAISFQVPRRHGVNFENFSELYGPFLVLVDLRQLLVGLP